MARGKVTLDNKEGPERLGQFRPERREIVLRFGLYAPATEKSLAQLVGALGG